MAIHDLWSLDNAPVGPSLLGGTTDLTRVTGSTNPYAYYTGNPGMIITNSTGTNTAVTSDGFLTMTRNTNGVDSPLCVGVSQVQSWNPATKFWVGFRTKASYAATSTTVGRVFNSLSAFNSTLGTVFVAETDLVAPANTELYVEVFIDTVALTYSVYINGVFLRTTAYTASTLGSAANFYYEFGTGTLSSTVVSGTRGFRDFYFMDVDSTDTTRLGPIRSSRASLTSIAGSEWVLNSAADLPTALNTALQNPPVTTPSASSPADNQILTGVLSTTLPAGANVVAMQPQLTLITDALGNSIDLAIKQSINTIDTGVISLPSSTTTYNQRLGIQRIAPDGGKWTAAKLNATTVQLTPAVAPPTAALLHFDGANGATTTTEVNGHAVAITGAGALSTTQSMFGGSSYAPNNTGNLKVTDTGDLATPGDFTVEFFVYWTSIPTTGFLVCKNSAGSTQAAILIISSNITIGMDDSSGPIPLATSNLTAGQWNHIAYSKSGTTIRLFINGVLKITGTTTQSWGNNALPLVVGSNGTGGNPTPGYIDELRVSKVARYITSFTPPVKAFGADGVSLASAFSSNTLATTFAPASATTTTALIASIMNDAKVNLVPEDIVSTAVAAGASTVTLTVAASSVNYVPGSTVTLTFAVPAKTVLLMHMDNTSSTTFVDEKGHAVTNPGALTAATTGRFGGCFPSGTNQLMVTSDPSMQLTGDCTVEMFLKHTNITQNGFPLAKGTSAQTGYQYIQSTSGLIRMLNAADGTVLVGTSDSSKTLVGVWQHIAFVRSGNTWTLWIDGVQAATANTAQPFGNNTYPLQIGLFTNAGSPLVFSGAIDELRLSTVARYKTAFTPPQAPFGADNVTLASVFASTSVTTPKPATSTTILAMLGGIATAAAVNLVPEDVVDGPVAAGAATVTLTAAATSTTYTPGSTVTLTLGAPGKTVALLHFDGSDALAGTLTSPAQLSTPSKFGATALFVPNTTNAKITYSSATSVQASGDFTIEAFCYYTSLTANGSMLVDKSVSASARAYVYFLNRQLRVLGDDGTTLLIGSATGLPVAGTTYFHFALVKQGTTWTAYVNGVSIGSVTSSATWGVNSGGMVIGNTYDNGACPFTGAIDEFRFSNVARYTGNFTPPTAAFVAD